jgi:multidrug efflux pump subunit AcrA (membrane-fusion protein)
VAPVTTVQRARLENTFQVAGEFIPFQEVELHAKVAGYIRRISVDIGDRVKAGQVLATLDVPELMAQVQGADAGVRQSQEQISRARSDVLRARANYEAVHSAGRLQQASKQRPDLIAQQEIDGALAKDRATAAQVDAAKAALSGTQHDCVPGAVAAGSDDMARNHPGHGANGAGSRSGQRAVCAARTSHHRRPYGLSHRHRVCCAGRIPLGA